MFMAQIIQETGRFVNSKIMKMTTNISAMGSRMKKGRIINGALKVQAKGREVKHISTEFLKGFAGWNRPIN